MAASGRLVRAKVLYNTSLGLLQLAVVCLAVGSTWGRTTALCLTDAAYVTFSVFFLTLLSVLCARGGRDFGAALAGSFLAQAANPGQLPALIVGLSALIVLAFTFLASESDYHTSWGMERPRSNRADPMAYYYSLGQICSAIVMQHPSPSARRTSCCSWPRKSTRPRSPRSCSCPCPPCRPTPTTYTRS